MGLTCECACLRRVYVGMYWLDAPFIHLVHLRQWRDARKGLPRLHVLRSDFRI